MNSAETNFTFPKLYYSYFVYKYFYIFCSDAIWKDAIYDDCI